WEVSKKRPKPLKIRCHSSGCPKERVSPNSLLERGLSFRRCLISVLLLQTCQLGTIAWAEDCDENETVTKPDRRILAV
ncbi:MAG: hypothetical protein WBF52_16170, partial [Geitlerinemataceae cyanobacterium]